MSAPLENHPCNYPMHEKWASENCDERATSESSTCGLSHTVTWGGKASRLLRNPGEREIAMSDLGERMNPLDELGELYK